MRAMIIEQFGGAEQFKVADVPRPEPAERDLMVEVAAVGINPVDTKIRRGYMKDRTPPLILGFDVCGKVVAFGAGVKGFKVGDVVFGCGALNRAGGCAELMCIDARLCAVKPKRLSVEETAALPLVMITAWESLHDRAKIQPGETVFIQAGAGGVGHIAIQLAKLHGCRVITTASREESVSMCRELGADVVIDYGKENVVEAVKRETGGKGAAVTCDFVGGEALGQCMDAVAINGRVVSIVHSKTDAIHDKLFRKSATLHLEFMPVGPIHGIGLEHHGWIMGKAAELADEGKLRPRVHEVFEMERVAEAHRSVEGGHVMGKVVVRGTPPLPCAESDKYFVGGELWLGRGVAGGLAGVTRLMIGMGVFVQIRGISGLTVGIGGVD